MVSIFNKFSLGMQEDRLELFIGEKSKSLPHELSAACNHVDRLLNGVATSPICRYDVGDFR